MQIAKARDQHRDHAQAGESAEDLGDDGCQYDQREGGSGTMVRGLRAHEALPFNARTDESSQGLVRSPCIEELLKASPR